jgi:RHS repeat-associated protein
VSQARDNVVEQRHGSGNAVARYTHGLGIDEPLEVYEGHGSYYYHADALGTITTLTKGNGSVANTYTYTSFGDGRYVAHETVANPFQFTAREYDPETELYYYRARYYDPQTGRFLSEDRLGFYADDNFYRYVKSDPVNYIDPSGLECDQASPWREIPTVWSGPGPKPYAVREEGLFWTRIDWDFAYPLRIMCICRWVAASTRIRKYYRVHVTEEALFKCTDCGGTREEYKTRDRVKQYETETRGRPIMPTQSATTKGPTVQIGGLAGSYPTKNNVRCLCRPPAQ